MIAPPRKTELGHDELRKRTRKLSQRHRTVLLLVDGKRSRVELLELVQRAGVAPGYFDELLAMGMVEEPALPTEPAPLAEPRPTAEAQAEPAGSEGLSEPVPQAEPGAEPVAVSDAVSETVLAEPGPQSAVAAAAAEEGAAEVATAERVEIEIAPPVTDVPPQPASPAGSAGAHPPTAAEAMRAGVADATPSVPVPEPPPAATPAEAVAPWRLDAEQRLLSEVRSLLIAALLVDGPLTNSLIALRVGRAKSRDELVALVWEIEKTLARSRRPREARTRLERARDLLGLGNTLVGGDTGFERDSQW